MNASGSPPLRIYFIRHGETEWSQDGRHTSRTDIPLTDWGEENARELRLRFDVHKFARVLTSPSRRARRTCELAGLASSAEIEPDLAEWNYGDYEGRRSPEIHRERPSWNIFHDGCPEGELPSHVSDRADRLIARLRAMHGDVALFSHGQFGCAFAARWIGSSVLSGQHFSLGTCSVSVLGFDPHHTRIPVIVHWNADAASAPDLLPVPNLNGVEQVNRGDK
jgi:probable phosphoglycerate mutase